MLIMSLYGFEEMSLVEYRVQRHEYKIKYRYDLYCV